MKQFAVTIMFIGQTNTKIVEAADAQEAAFLAGAAARGSYDYAMSIVPDEVYDRIAASLGKPTLVSVVAQ